MKLFLCIALIVSSAVCLEKSQEQRREEKKKSVQLNVSREIFSGRDPAQKSILQSESLGDIVETCLRRENRRRTAGGGGGRGLPCTECNANWGGQPMTTQKCTTCRGIAAFPTCSTSFCPFSSRETYLLTQASLVAACFAGTYAPVCVQWKILHHTIQPLR